MREFARPIPRSIRWRTTRSAGERRARADCALPLYWPAPQQVLSARAGAHRFTWDLRYDPIGEEEAAAAAAARGGAVPHRTYRA